MRKYLSIVILILLTVSLSAQEHGEIKWIDGVKYVYHKIEEKETLYGLSKKYDIKINDILLNNPEAIESIKPGMLLRIPLSKKKDIIEEELVLDGDFLIHIVKPQETLYSLAKQYELTQEEIKSVNDLSERLKVGMKLKIPIKESFGYEAETPVEEDEDSTKQNTFVFNHDSVGGKNLRVALLIPLYLDLNDTIEINKKEDADPQLPAKVEPSLEVYGGVFLALDSLKKLGYSVSLRTYDTEGDTNVIRRLTKEVNFNHFDLVIGPMSSTNYQFFINEMDSINFGSLNPFSSSSEILKLNKNVIKARANRKSELNAISKYIGKSKSSANVVLVYETTTKRDYEELLKMKDQLTFTELKFGTDTIVKMPTLVNYRATGMNGLITSFNDSVENVVVMVSENPSFVTQTLQKLEPFTEDFTITVFGTSKWNSFKTFEPELYDYLDIHLSSTGSIQYEDSSVVQFQKKYFDYYRLEPSVYSFQLFDQTFAVGKSLCSHQGYKNIYVLGKDHKGYYSNYRFYYTGDSSGIENQTAFIVRFQDYKFVRVNE